MFKLPLALIAAFAAQDGVTFRDIELPVRTSTGGLPKDYILQVNGGGLALADFNRDGALDLVVVDGSDLERVAKGEPGFPARLFLGGAQGEPGGFAPAGESWSLPASDFGAGCAAGDVDGDGWLDLFLAAWGKDHLVRNTAGTGFEDVTEKSGLSSAGWTTSAAFLDYDRDGTLDLYCVRYLAFELDQVTRRGAGDCTWKGAPVMCGPEGLVPLHDLLFHGNGDGTFEDVSKHAGLTVVESAFGLGVMTLDYDVDGDTDLFVTNDSTPNHLWENLGEGRFREVGFARGVSHDAGGREQAGMGIACADLDGDGRQDLFVTNFSGEANAFYASVGKRGFRERSNRFGLAGPSLHRLGWGTGLHDFDLDGRPEIFVLDGHVYPEADRPGTDTSYAQGDLLFEFPPLTDDDADARAPRFVARALAEGPAYVSRAGIAGDVDGDGDLDLVVLELDGPVHLLRNEIERGERHFLRVALEGKRSNRFGLGSRLELQVGDTRFTAEIRTSGGYQTAGEPEAYFGLGEAEGPLVLVINWISGVRQEVTIESLDQRVLIREPAPEREEEAGSK